MNLFDESSYPLDEPEVLYVGDTWTWKRLDLSADYPTASYSLKYSMRLAGTGSTEIEITATESNSTYIVSVAATTTAAYTAGTYHWQAYITRTSDSARVVVDAGIVEVKPNRDANTADPRTHAQITLGRIEAAIQALNMGVSSYSINGRSMTYRDLSELEEMRDKYRAEVGQEERKENKRGGAKLVYRFKRL